MGCGGVGRHGGGVGASGERGGGGGGGGSGVGKRGIVVADGEPLRERRRWHGSRVGAFAAATTATELVLVHNGELRGDAARQSRTGDGEAELRLARVRVWVKVKVRVSSG